MHVKANQVHTRLPTEDRIPRPPDVNNTHRVYDGDCRRAEELADDDDQQDEEEYGLHLVGVVVGGWRCGGGAHVI